MNGCPPGGLSSGLLGELGILDEQGRRIDPDAGHTAVEPEPKDILVLGPHIGVRPVEVGLLGREQMQVPLARPVRILDPRPRRAAEDRLPAVRGQFAVRPRARPEPEPRPFGRAGWSVQRGTKPRVLVRDVIRDDVDDAANPEGSRGCDELLGLLEGSERGIDGPVIRHVVPRVGHRRRVPGVEPKCVDPEVTEVGQPGENSRQIADPVAVRVRKAPDVHLVDDGVAPPAGIGDRGADPRCGFARTGRVLGRCRRVVAWHAARMAHPTIECKSKTKSCMFMTYRCRYPCQRPSISDRPQSRGVAPRLRARPGMTARRPGAMGECEARTQGAPVAVATGATEDEASCRRARPGDTAFILGRALRRLT